MQVVNGDHGEFTVSVNDKVAAQKGESLPTEEEVLSAVKKAA